MGHAKAIGALELDLQLKALKKCIKKALSVRQAEEFGHSFQREIAYLTAHSMLHLLGYDHIENMDKLHMREKEAYCLQKQCRFRSCIGCNKQNVFS